MAFHGVVQCGKRNVVERNPIGYVEARTSGSCKPGIDFERSICGATSYTARSAARERQARLRESLFNFVAGFPEVYKY